MSGLGLPRTGVRFRPVDAESDVELLHGWFQTEHVGPWWGLIGPRERTAGYLRAAEALDHQRSWIATDDDGAFGYVETYVVTGDALARHYDAQPGDRGWHVLVGDPERLGTGATRRLGIATLCGLLGEDEATRALCEPDVRNRRMLGYCASLGAREEDRFPFGEKTAALLAWPREVVAAAWADDLAAAVSAGRAWDRMDGIGF